MFFYRGKLIVPREVINRNLTSVLLFVGYNLVFGFARTGIDNAAHVGGLVTGLVSAGLLLRARAVAKSGSHKGSTTAIAVVALLLGLGAVLAVLRADDSTLDQGRAAIHYTEGVDHLEKGKLDAAIDAFTEVIKADPTFFDAYINRGVAHLRNRGLLLAIADFDAAVDLSPERPEAYANRGIAYAMIGQFERALDDLGLAIDSYPDDGDLHFFRGMVYAEIGESDKAAADLEKALTIDLDPEFRQDAEALLELLHPE
jgi:tetratricopeptide (TPR) repeat protein